MRGVDRQVRDALQQEEEFLLMTSLDELKKPDKIRKLVLMIIKHILIKRQPKNTVRIKIPLMPPEK